MHAGPYLVDLIASPEGGTYCKASDIAALAVARIPVTGNLEGIHLEKDGIEHKLPG